MLAIAGAAGGALLVALLESIKAAREWKTAWAETFVGDAAVLIPLATILALVVCVGMMFLDPDRSWSLPSLQARTRSASPEAVARAGAFAMLAPAAALVWLLASAHMARAMLLRSPEPWTAGAALGATSVLVLAASSATVLALVPATARTITSHVNPWIVMAVSVTLVLGCGAAGIGVGDTSGNGATPLAILGVLARRASSISRSSRWGSSCLIAVGVASERVAPGRWGRVLVAAVIGAGAWALVVQQAYAFNDEADVAHAIELGAPLGRVGLTLARRATDRDRDGTSGLFAGGDCNDSDKTISPNAHRTSRATGSTRTARAPTCRSPSPRRLRPRRRASPCPSDLNLLLITVDTLRVDLGFMGYPRPVSPNLDALAARSTVFDRAYSMASYTGKSVGPTLIGKYPSETLRDGAHFDTYFQGNVFLAERLHDAGFHTMGAASHWYFQPKYGLPQGMDTWDMSALPNESAGDADSWVTSDTLTDAAIRMLSDTDATAHRFMLWVHYFDPHANYVAHKDAPDFRQGASNWAKPAYDGEVWFTDHHIGRLLDFIASQPWGARTAIMVTADHGETFDEHGMSFHGAELWEQLVRVPFIVYVPGVKPHRIANKRSLIDLAPTVLDLMGLPQPPEGELSGESNAAIIVAPDEATIDERDVYLDMPWGPRVSQHRAIIHGPTPGLKLMAPGGRIYALYDLSKDPWETNDISMRDRSVLAQMIEAFDDKHASLHEIHVEPPPQ